MAGLSDLDAFTNNFATRLASSVNRQMQTLWSQASGKMGGLARGGFGGRDPYNFGRMSPGERHYAFKDIKRQMGDPKDLRQVNKMQQELLNIQIELAKKVPVVGRVFSKAYEAMRSDKSLKMYQALYMQVIDLASAAKDYANSIVSIGSAWKVVKVGMGIGIGAAVAGVALIKEAIDEMVGVFERGWQITKDWFNDLYAAAGGLAKQFGLTGKQVGAARGQIEGLYLQYSSLIDSMSEVVELQSAYIEKWSDVDVAIGKGREMTKMIFEMSRATGTSADEAATFLRWQERAFGRETTNAQKGYVKRWMGIGKAIGVPMGTIIKGMIEQKRLFAVLGHEGEAAFTKLIILQKKTGVGAAEIASAMEKFDSLEEVIPTVSKLNLLFGSSIDAFKLWSDFDPANRAIEMVQAVKDTGTSWEQMTPVMRKALSAQIGLSEESTQHLYETKGSLRDVYDEQQKVAKAAAATNAQWADMVNATKSYFIDLERLWRPFYSQIAHLYGKAGFGKLITQAVGSVIKGLQALFSSPGWSVLVNEVGKTIADIGNTAGTFLKALSGETVTNFIDALRDGWHIFSDLVKMGAEYLAKKLPGWIDIGVKKFKELSSIAVDWVEGGGLKRLLADVVTLAEKAGNIATSVGNVLKWMWQNKGTILAIVGALKIGGMVSSVYRMANAHAMASSLAGQGVTAAAQQALGGGSAYGGPSKRRGMMATLAGQPATAAGGAGGRGGSGWLSRRVGGAKGFAGSMGAGMATALPAIAMGYAEGGGSQALVEGIAGAVGSAVGSIWGPAGAMIGGAVLPMITGLIYKMVGPVDRAKEAMESLAKAEETRIAAEKKLTETLSEMRGQFRDTQTTLDGYDSLVKTLSGDYDAQHKTFKLTLANQNEFADRLVELQKAGFLTEEQFKRIHDTGLGASEFNNLKTSIADYTKVQTQLLIIAKETAARQDFENTRQSIEQKGKQAQEALVKASLAGGALTSLVEVQAKARAAYEAKKGWQGGYAEGEQLQGPGEQAALERIRKITGGAFGVAGYLTSESLATIQKTMAGISQDIGQRTTYGKLLKEGDVDKLSEFFKEAGLGRGQGVNASELAKAMLEDYSRKQAEVVGVQTEALDKLNDSAVALSKATEDQKKWTADLFGGKTTGAWAQANQAGIEELNKRVVTTAGAGGPAAGVALQQQILNAPDNATRSALLARGLSGNLAPEMAATAGAPSLSVSPLGGLVPPISVPLTGGSNKSEQQDAANEFGVKLLNAVVEAVNKAIEHAPINVTMNPLPLKLDSQTLAYAVFKQIFPTTG